MGLHLLDYAILVQSATGMEILVQGLYSQKVVNGGRWYDDRIMCVRSAIAIHETYRT